MRFPGKDSNPDPIVQSDLSYRWTTREWRNRVALVVGEGIEPPQSVTDAWFTIRLP